MKIRTTFLSLLALTLCTQADAGASTSQKPSRMGNRQMGVRNLVKYTAYIATTKDTKVYELPAGTQCSETWIEKDGGALLKTKGAAAVEKIMKFCSPCYEKYGDKVLAHPECLQSDQARYLGNSGTKGKEDSTKALPLAPGRNINIGSTLVGINAHGVDACKVEEDVTFGTDKTPSVGGLLTTQKLMCKPGYIAPKYFSILTRGAIEESPTAGTEPVEGDALKVSRQAIYTYVGLDDNKSQRLNSGNLSHTFEVESSKQKYRIAINFSSSAGANGPPAKEILQILPETYYFKWDSQSKAYRLDSASVSRPSFQDKYATLIPYFKDIKNASPAETTIINGIKTTAGTVPELRDSIFYRTPTREGILTLIDIRITPVT